MNLSITTPILLFPALSLILLAYTAKFAHLANLVRNLYKQYSESESEELLFQIRNIKLRIHLIKWMQGFGTASFCLCMVSIFMLFVKWDLAGQSFFWISLVLLFIAIYFSLQEIWLSTRALTIVISEVYKQ